jgi:hypothetical protein
VIEAPIFTLRLIGSALALGLAPLSAQAPFSRNCLHGAAESAADRARRQQAIDYATKVNVAETAYGIAPGPQFQRGYRSLDQLTNLPLLPAGFAIQFHNDDHSYTFSLKDTRDTCHYAIFSDQDKLVYEAIPRADATAIVPLGTR